MSVRTCFGSNAARSASPRLGRAQGLVAIGVLGLAGVGIFVSPLRAAGSSSGAALGEDPIAAIPMESVPAGTTMVGASSPITLDGEVVVNGTVRHRGVLQQGNNALATYELTTERYLVEARPIDGAGFVIVLDHDIVVALCRDKDGCEVSLQMVNWDESGAVASTTKRLFLSETSNRWSLSDTNLDALTDDDDVIQSWQAHDCVFTDGETMDELNFALDSNVGFSLINLYQGTHSDEDTTCRMVFLD